MLIKENSNDLVSLVNHASILIESSAVKLLTDPWFSGDAFNNGWNLLYENHPNHITQLLDEVTHIFISHEHPDHFSIPFFKEYCNQLLAMDIKIIFQETRDQRVVKFLKSLKLTVIEAKKNEWIELDAHIHIQIFPVGAIDSTFLMRTSENYFINTNDCELSSFDGKKILNEMETGKQIVLLHQFSYAAWRANSEWMKKAGKYKLKKLLELNQLFNASLLVPFASFIYFSHEENFNLNRDVNKPKIVSNFLNNNNIIHSFLNIYPNKYLVSSLINNHDYLIDANKRGLGFWDDLYNDLYPKHSPSSNTDSISEVEIAECLKRIRCSNNILLMRFINIISFNLIFGESKIFIKDLNQVYSLSFISIKKITESRATCAIEISFDSFILIIRQVYGLDTLSVNGRLSEINPNGFRKFIYSMGFLTLNSSGYGIRFRDFFNISLLQRLISIPVRLILKND
jgi:UDP-MurNAc hydroxylase